MASLAPASAANQPAPPSRLGSFLRRLVPAEGWITVLLHVVIVLATASAVERAAWAPEGTQLAVLAVVGLLTGLVLAKLRTPDLLAHLVSLWLGLAVVVVVAAERLADVAGGRRERLAHLWDLSLEWYRSILSGRTINDPELFAALLGLTIWLVAYTSAWVLYRRGWLTTAIVLPAVITIVNLGYAPEDGSWPLLFIVVAGCLLAARHHFYRREVEWSRIRLPRPQHLTGRFLFAGATVALAVAALSWTLPVSARAQVVEAIWQRIQEPWSDVVERWDDWMGNLAGPGIAEGGSYANFGDQFQLGGALNLSDDPVLLLEPSGQQYRPTYLIGYRYDKYTGQGWATTVDETFQQPDTNEQYSPLLNFSRGQAINLTPSVLTNRSQVVETLRVLQPKGNLVFTIDTYLTSDVQTSVQLPWRQVEDQAFELRPNGEDASVILNRIPVELRQFAQMLMRADFPAAAADSPAPLEPGMAAEIETARVQLERRFLNARWETGSDGKVAVLYVTGQLPVYDDVEAVFSRQPMSSGDVYEVTGLASTAGAAELQQAGTDYPGWVTDRYLPLPETVTDRTRALARDLAAGQSNPFDTAIAVQTYVRETIEYNEDIGTPPRDRDVVDYVLFDSQQGYCEYYASAMAVLLRSEGIPARVVGGYFPVPFDAEEGGFLYREKNAHLWVEVFFPGYGWIPFEPTASQQALTYGGLAAAELPEPTPEPEPEPEAAPPPVATPEPEPTEVPPAAVTDEPTEPPQPPNRLLVLAALGVALLVIMATIAGSIVWLWGFRGLSPTSGFYARILRLGRWGGIRPSPAMTPYEYALRLGRAIPAASRPAQLVADLYNQETFAGRAATPVSIAAARRAWIQLRRAIVRSLLRRQHFGRESERG